MVVESNEAAQPGSPDWKITDDGSGGFLVELRAARSGKGTGRFTHSAPRQPTRPERGTVDGDVHVTAQPVAANSVESRRRSSTSRSTSSFRTRSPRGSAISAFNGYIPPRSPLCPKAARQGPRICAGGHPHPGAVPPRQSRDLRRRPVGPDPAVAVSGIRSHRLRVTTRFPVRRRTGGHRRCRTTYHRRSDDGRLRVDWRSISPPAVGVEKVRQPIAPRSMKVTPSFFRVLRATQRGPPVHRSGRRSGSRARRRCSVYGLRPRQACRHQSRRRHDAAVEQ